MFEFLVVVGGLVTLLLVHRRFEAQERRLGAMEAYLRSVGPPMPGVADASPAMSAPPGSDLAPVQESGPPVAPTPVAPTPVAPSDPVPGPAWPSRLPPPRLPPPLPPGTAPGLPPAPRPSPVPPGNRDLEEVLGSRWAVWVGGAALALGGIFLVRYSIEEGLLGPGFRVTLGLLFAIALMAGGEWLRRRETPLSVSAFPTANIPAILTAAGTSTAFASIYAAYGLYGLIGPALAFVALGIVALATMAAALLHGPALGALGLVAALAAPALVESRDPSPVALVLYLAFAVGAAYGVARLRLWRWLAISAAIGAWLWGWALILMGGGWVAGSLTHVVIQLALALLFLVLDAYRGQRDDEAVTDRMVVAVLFGFALLAAAASFDLSAGLARPVFIGLVSAMMVGAGFLFPAAASGLAAASLAVILTFAAWPVAGEAAREPERLVRDLASAPLPEALTTYVAAALLLGAGILAAGFLRLALGRALRLGPAAWYAGAATLGPLALLIVAYWRLTAFDRSIPFAVMAGVLGLVFAGAAGWLRRQDPADESPAIRLAIGAAASAAVAALAAGLTFAFDRGVLTVALSLSALGTAAIAERVRVPALRWVVGAIGLAVAARLAWDPTVMRGEIGTTPIVNWLLWGYGVPALAFGLATRILARTGRDALVRFIESLSFLFAALLVFLEIRHALHAGAPFTNRSSHLEAGLVVTEALGFTLLAIRLDLRAPDPLYRALSTLFGALSLAGAALALGVRFNPYISGEPILGGPLLDSLLPAYLIPAALAAWIAGAAARALRPRAFVLAAAALALSLELAYGFLEVRHLFQGERIGFLRSTSQAEFWCYSLVLLANGIVLLGAGILWRSRLARMASAACIAVTVLKVFLLDLSALQGLTRALSFVGLGLTLVAIGFVYQRLLAPRAGPAP